MGSHSVTCHPAEVTFPPCVVWPTLGLTTAGEQNRTAKYRIDSVCLHSTTVPLLEGSTSPLNPHPQKISKILVAPLSLPQQLSLMLSSHCRTRQNCCRVGSGGVNWIGDRLQESGTFETICRRITQQRLPFAFLWQTYIENANFVNFKNS